MRPSVPDSSPITASWATTSGQCAPASSDVARRAPRATARCTSCAACCIARLPHALAAASIASGSATPASSSVPRVLAHRAALIICTILPTPGKCRISRSRCRLRRVFRRMAATSTSPAAPALASHHGPLVSVARERSMSHRVSGGRGTPPPAALANRRSNSGMTHCSSAVTTAMATTSTVDGYASARCNLSRTPRV